MATCARFDSFDFWSINLSYICACALCCRYARQAELVLMMELGSKLAMSPNEYAAVVKLYHSDYRAFPVRKEVLRQDTPGEEAGA